MPAKKVYPSWKNLPNFAAGAAISAACFVASRDKDERVAAALGVLCFVVGSIFGGSTMDYDLLLVAYNQKTGVVLVTRIEYLLTWSVGYKRGRTSHLQIDSGGRICAAAVAGMSNPFNMNFCGRAHSY